MAVLLIGGMLLVGCLSAKEVRTDHDGFLKAHATLINSRWHTARRHTFDATGLLRELSLFDFGEARLSQLQLNRMGSIDRETGYYQCETAIQLDAS